MDIRITIGTVVNRPSDKVAAGFATLLNTILEEANRCGDFQAKVFRKLEAKHGEGCAFYFSELLPTIDGVQSVEFVTPVATASSEGPEWIFLEGERAKRAEDVIRGRWAPTEMVRFSRPKIHRPSRSLVGWVKADPAIHERVSYTLRPEELESILHGPNRSSSPVEVSNKLPQSPGED